MFRRELKAAKMVAIVIGFFFLCVVPIVLVDIIEIVCGRCVPTWFVKLSVCLSYMNPAVNVLVYAATNNDYRRAYKKLLVCDFFKKATSRVRSRDKSSGSRNDVYYISPVV